MNTKDFWKIFTADKSVMVLTFVPKEFRNGDGVYFLMKNLQKIYGAELCSMQKFDERFDKIEDFDIILRTGYNLDLNRLICVHLFEYDKKSEKMTLDRQKSWKIVEDSEFVYSFKQTIVKCMDGWSGFRKHIIWTMEANTCCHFFGDEFADKFKLSPIMETDRRKTA